MKKTKINVRIVLLSLALCIMLTAVSAFCLTACKEKTPDEPKTTEAPAQSGDVIEKGTGAILIGEVSQCNDDNTDNRFNPPVGRFPAIEEDEPPYRLLCNEYPEAT